MQLFKTGLSEHKQREKEVNSFISGQTKLVADSQQIASHILAKFEQQHKEVSNEVLKRPVLGGTQQTYAANSINLLLL